MGNIGGKVSSSDRDVVVLGLVSSQPHALGLASAGARDHGFGVEADCFMSAATARTR